ncbi:MAG: 2-deoxyribose-5-phosphate aldolase [Prochlorococcus sp. SP3034]|nr:2-deoxyribose-5-phosphate aldolase [Prochlorococcus sp. SP3034]|tara:strand:- start:9314 stop:9970 length:657 start_codon:yes stop_codon:yes gene_type:complete
MSNSEYEFNEKINAILINPYLSLDEFNINCNLLKKYNIKNISTTLNYLSYLRNLFDNNININTFISYPLADSPHIITDQMIDLAIEEGASGIEYLPQFFYLENNEDEKFATDIEKIYKKKLPLTLIFNKNRMKKKTFTKAIQISLELGIKIFQFGDGFGSTLNISDLKEIKALLNKKSLIKISGNIRNIKTIKELLNNGADNIGTSYFHEIFQELKSI